MIQRLTLAIALFTCSGCALAPPEPNHFGRDVEPLIQVGVAALRHGDLTNADAAFEMAYDINPQAQSLDGRGCVAMLRGNYVEAERFFLAALRQDPSYRGALGNLALLYEMSGRRGEAIALYRAALKSLPSNVQIRNNFAAALAGGGRGKNTEAEDRAIRELRKAAVLAPHPIIMRNLEVLEAP